MHLSNESLLVIILVGLIAGWLAGQVMLGSGFGLIGDLIVGLLGALIGDWLLPRAHSPPRRRGRVGGTGAGERLDIVHRQGTAKKSGDTNPSVTPLRVRRARVGR